MKNDVALLAPVPLEHLIDGEVICNEQGKVAFGSRAWELFRKLDEIRDNEPVDVYIYASHSVNGPVFKVSWIASYIGHVESKSGAHPDGMRFRPPSTGKHTGDNHGHWAIFWEVVNLRRLPIKEYILTGDFIGYEKIKPYTKNFVPEGPILILNQPNS
jgi:hypothetical protein